MVSIALHICIDNVYCHISPIAKNFYVGQGPLFFLPFLPLISTIFPFSSTALLQIVPFDIGEKTVLSIVEVQASCSTPTDRPAKGLILILARSHRTCLFFSVSASVRLQFSCPGQIGFFERKALMTLALILTNLKAFH